MMRLVVQYSVGDGVSWYAENTLPVVYESAEAFLVDFEKMVKTYSDKHWTEREFFLGGQRFDCSECSEFFFEGKYQPPKVMTVDEWFAELGVEE